MDPRLKERLIGAAVLVALGVWLIPWILDGPDPQPATAPVAELPADAGGSVPIRTRTIDLNRRSGGAGAASTAVQAAADTAAAAPDAIIDGPAAVAGIEPAPPQVAEAIAERPRDARPAGAAAAAAEPTLPVPTATETQAAALSEIRAAAEPTLPVPNAAARNDAGGWVVQLGSFREQDNADREATRVTALGFEPAVSVFTAGARSMYRVRVGPYDSRGRADEIASALVANGFVAQVVAN